MIFRDEDQFDSFSAFWMQPGLQEHIKQVRECLGCTTWQAFMAMRPTGVWWDEGALEGGRESDSSGGDSGEGWRGH